MILRLSIALARALTKSLTKRLSKKARFEDRCLDVTMEAHRHIEDAQKAVHAAPSIEEIKIMIKGADEVIDKANKLTNRLPLPKGSDGFAIVMLNKCKEMRKVYLELYIMALQNEFPSDPPQERIDAILDKISASGTESLTPIERSILAKF